MKTKIPAGTIQGTLTRRNFIETGTKLIGAALVVSPFGNAMQAQTSNTPITVGVIMDQFMKEVSGAPFNNTIDTLKAGNWNIEVKGIVTTMFATIDIIRKTIDRGANFIIAHEPTFYNHLDETQWLENDEVYLYKKKLLDDHQIAVWRNHDYIHSHRPDGVKSEVVSKLGWTTEFDAVTNVAIIPSTPLNALINHAKKKLGIQMLRYIGDLQQTCRKILLMPGAAGGKRQIEAMIATQPDVLMCGEIAEWETAEYVRDARAKGQKLSLVVLGHIASEEPGSEYMASWLKEKFPSIKSIHLPAGNSLQFM